MSFEKLNTTELDKDLSPEERAEWNAIYASYRAGSLLAGEISGIDSYTVNDNGEKMLAAVIINYRVKILIPEKLLWSDHEDMTKAMTRNLLGAKIEYVIQEIDRENSVCVASRIAALKIRRRQFWNDKPKVGSRVKCSVLAVGVKKIFVEVYGFEMRLKRRALCYSLMPDFRLRFSTGQSLTAVITKADRKENILEISVREASPHPYIGIRKRHPINSRRTSVITGKYKGSVFCRLEDDFECLCNYSEYQNDDDFQIGDRVVIVVKEFDDKAKRVYGVIVSKWN